ncbi:MAG: hypothetical protein ACE5GJ_02310 [Gemmatimonadota bacterium]
MSESPAASAIPRALLFPLAMAAALAAYLFFPPIRELPSLWYTFLGAAAVVVAWAAVLWFRYRRSGRRLGIEVMVRKPHFVQMCAQGAVLLYWGWYVRSVYAYAPLILAQIIFAYAVDSLLSFVRYGNYRLGVGPIPVVFSINLFLWFKLEWFYWQFAMVALVFFGKEFIRWTRDGRRVHIFNPSLFALAVASVALILTQSTGITYGVEIAATQNNPPHIFLLIFLAALPGQLLFGVGSMTMAAAVTVVAFGLLHLQITGTYFFYDAFIPIAVFLGMNLLFTDPSTSPRSELGRVIYGILYGVGIILSVYVLEAIDAPTFYDKLLPVPFLNLMVRAIDRFVANRARGLTLPGWKKLSPLRRNAVVVATWVGVFSAFSATQIVGDEHPGKYLPYWRDKCEEGNDRACDYLGVVLDNFCLRGSGWACNELGLLVANRSSNPADAEQEFQRACRMGFEPGCRNAQDMARGVRPSARDRPPVEELHIVLRGTKGPVTLTDPDALFDLGCQRGWTELCR